MTQTSDLHRGQWQQIQPQPACSMRVVAETHKGKLVSGVALFVIGSLVAGGILLYLRVNN